MVYKEVSRVEIEEIIRQWQAGRGIREIARSTGISRNTIRKYLLTAQSYGLVRNGPATHRLTTDFLIAVKPGWAAKDTSSHR